jgi:hypothetical protein
MIEKRRKKHARLTYQTKSLPLQSEFGRVALPSVRSNRSPTLQKIRFFDEKDPKLSLSELLSRMTRIQIYSYDLLCEPVLSMHTV